MVTSLYFWKEQQEEVEEVGAVAVEEEVAVHQAGARLLRRMAVVQSTVTVTEKTNQQKEKDVT